MQSVTRIALASLALLGSSAALAQPYGNGRDYGREYRRDNGADYRRCYDQPYGPPECAQLRQRPDFQAYHDRNGATIINWIIDPATGMPISEPQYLARYPGSNPGTWNYDPATNLWIDHTPQNPGYNPQGQNYDRDRGYDRDRERERERQRERN
jgi:hypothetical protein